MLKKNNMPIHGELVEPTARSQGGVEYHPLLPFLPENTKVLFLGSFPPQRKRWCCDFFYPNWINDHWRLEGEVFFGNRNHFVDLENKTFRLDILIPFLRQKGIGFFDTATAVRRLKDNASDAFLEVVEETDIHALLSRIPACRTIVTTGGKATETLCRVLGIDTVPAIGSYVEVSEHLFPHHPGLVLYRLPSSSRAYPLPFAQKASLYRQMFVYAGLTTPTSQRAQGSPLL